MPRISVITPLYNGVKTLSETAESIFNQDYTDWEWIMYDDGSSDGTKETAMNIAERHREKVFYFEHKNNGNYGTSYTRNRAVEKSTGEIVAFIDQDDIWYKNRLSVQMSILEKISDCAMIWGPALYWYKEREFKQPVGYRGKGLNSGLYKAPYFVEVFLSDLRGTPLPSASLLRRKNFDEVSGYEETIRGSEDVVLWLKIAENSEIYYHDEILIKYRKHQDSTLRIAKESGKMNEWDLVFYKWVIDFLKRTSAKKELIDDSEYAYYSCIKKIAGKKKYFESRRELYNRLKLYPELKNKFMKDFLLDVILPFNVSSRISAKMRFDWFKQ